nr:MAG TPA: hypothetical protein [Caudoviricetes sp.]
MESNKKEGNVCITIGLAMLLVSIISYHLFGI